MRCKILHKGGCLIGGVRKCLGVPPVCATLCHFISGGVRALNLLQAEGGNGIRTWIIKNNEEECVAECSSLQMHFFLAPDCTSMGCFSNTYNMCLLNRKTCQACKCPRDTHAVYHQQLTSVRDRLGFKSDSHTSKIDARQLGYTWAPPGLLTSAKVKKYFDLISPEKVPKIASTGERYRDKQLAYQLPKQDLAMTYCKHVEPQHRSSYEDFVSARNEIALDIGKTIVTNFVCSSPILEDE